MAKTKSNPFGMTDADISKISKLAKNAKSTVTISLPRFGSWHRFTCYWCNTTRNESNAVRSPSNRWICSRCITGSAKSKTLTDQGGCNPKASNNHRYGIRTHNGRIGCIGCAGFSITNRSTGEIKSAEVISTLADIEKKLNQSAAKKNKTLLEKAEPYIRSGLAEPFAMAIVRGVDDAQVLDLWESTWWRQYPEDDVLIVSVLDGIHSEDVARTINGFRGEHPELAMACINKHVTTDWATMLLESGFEEHPDAVRDVLDGGEPHIVARIRRMNVNKKGLPPGLGGKVKTTPLGEKKKSSNVADERKFMKNMNNKQWAGLYSTHLRRSVDNTRNREKIRRVYETGWVNQKTTKKELNDWGKLFRIPKRTNMSKEQLLRAVRQKATDIRAYVRNQMD